MVRCVICERRPARTPEGYCGNCDSKLEAQNRCKQADKPVKFLTYRGSVVGLYRNGKGMLTPKLLKRSPDNLPKTRTLNLNRYCEGYTRDMIKAFKKSVLQLANA